MKKTLLVLSLLMLAGCAIVPLGCYDAGGRHYPSSHYSPPHRGHHGNGDGYGRPGYAGRPGPRFDGKADVRGYGHPDNYGYRR